RVSPRECVVDGAGDFSFSRGLGIVSGIEFGSSLGAEDIYDSHPDLGLSYRFIGFFDSDIGLTDFISTWTNNMPPKRSSATARAAAAAARAAAATAAAATPMTAAAVEQLIEARVSAALSNHETLRNSTNGHGDGSHNSKTRIRGTV
ncbi:hypothetical protein Tco_0160461, partial [Tanacetum coccineum]